MQQTVTTICNLKGGTTKTTTVLAFSYALANKGHKVLAIDFDGQANLTRSFGKYSEENDDIYEWLELNKDVRIRVVEGLDLIPATRKGVNALLQEIQKDMVSPSHHLARQLQLYPDYDFVLIDVPSSHGYELTNALIASDSVVIPTTPEFLSIEGMDEACGWVCDVKNYKPDINITGVLINKVETSTNEHRLCVDETINILEDYGIDVYSSIVRKSTLVSKSQRLHSDFYKSISKNPAAQDFIKIVDEYLVKVGV